MRGQWKQLVWYKEKIVMIFGDHDEETLYRLSDLMFVKCLSLCCS